MAKIENVALIFPQIIHNKKLTFLDKILFAELTFLVNKNGKMHKLIDYFIKVFNVCEDEIIEALNHLQETKIIDIKVVEKNDKKTVFFEFLTYYYNIIYNIDNFISNKTNFVDKNNRSSNINDSNISNNTSDVDKNYASNNIHSNSSNDNCIPTNDCNVDKNYTTEEKEKIKETNCSNDTNLGNKEKQKEKMAEIQEIIDWYDSMGIHKTRTIDEHLISLIKKKIKQHGKEQLKKIIKRFAMVIKDPKFFYNYAWKLETLLSRKKGTEYFDDDGEKWLDYTSRRPTINTTKAFEMLWNIYPNKNSKDKAREEYDKFFIGITSVDEARQIATKIYSQAKEYIYETDDQYVKNLNNFLRQIAQK